MATRVYTEERITLQDEQEVVLRPLVISRLRRFMEAWAKFTEAETEEQGMDVYINCAGIALENNYKDKFDVKPTKDEKEEGLFIGVKYKEHLEDTLELDSIYKILDVCGGIKLNDPKALEAAMEAAVEAAREDGTSLT